MGRMDSLYSILEESLKLYSDFTKVEYEKYDAIVKEDIDKLDEIISKEQVFYLKTKGLEQKRDKIIDSLNMKDKTFKEIIEMCEEEDSIRLNILYDKLSKSLANFKDINLECKTLINVRLHKIDTASSKLGEKDNTYSNIESKKSNLNSHIVYKKI